MPNIPLPKQSLPFSLGGLANLYQQACQMNPAVRTQIANEIQADPIAALNYLFQLTAAQEQMLNNPANANEISSQAGVVVSELKKANPGTVQFVQNTQPTTTAPVTGAQTMIDFRVSCSCARHV